MKQLDCDVYIDLMPLVRDGAASPASEQALADHLAGCERCRALYVALPAAPAGTAEKTLARLRRTALILLGALTLLGALLGAALSGSAGMFYNLLILPLTGAAAYFVLRRRAWLLAPAGMFVLTYLWLAAKSLLAGEFSDPGRTTAELLAAPAVWGFWYSVFCLGGVALGWLLCYAFGQLPPSAGGQTACARRQLGRRLKRIAAAALAVGVTAAILFFTNRMTGNPFSKMVARADAERWIGRQWPELDLRVTEVAYSFKTGGYTVQVESDTSIDTRFPLYYDSFGRGEMSGTLDYWRHRNAAERAGRQYRALCEGLLAEFETDPAAFAYGELEFDGSDWAQPDAALDAAALGRAGGVLTVYLTDGRLSAGAAAQWLLRLRQVFDDAGVGFARVNLTMMAEHSVGERYESVHLTGVEYEEITAEGLTERARQHMEDVAANFAAEDARAAAPEEEAIPGSTAANAG